VILVAGVIVSDQVCGEAARKVAVLGKKRCDRQTHRKRIRVVSEREIE